MRTPPVSHFMTGTTFPLPGRLHASRPWVSSDARHLHNPAMYGGRARIGAGGGQLRRSEAVGARADRYPRLAELTQGCWRRVFRSWVAAARATRCPAPESSSSRSRQHADRPAHQASAARAPPQALPFELGGERSSSPRRARERSPPRSSARLNKCRDERGSTSVCLSRVDRRRRHCAVWRRREDQV